MFLKFGIFGTIFSYKQICTFDWQNTVQMKYIILFYVITKLVLCVNFDILGFEPSNN